MRQRLVLAHHDAHDLLEQYCVLGVDVSLTLQKGTAVLCSLSRSLSVRVELTWRLAVDSTLDMRQILD